MPMLVKHSTVAVSSAAMKLCGQNMQLKAQFHCMSHNNNKLNMYVPFHPDATGLRRRQFLGLVSSLHWRWLIVMLLGPPARKWYNSYKQTSCMPNMHHFLEVWASGDLAFWLFEPETGTLITPTPVIGFAMPFCSCVRNRYQTDDRTHKWAKHTMWSVWKI